MELTVKIINKKYQLTSKNGNPRFLTALKIQAVVNNPKTHQNNNTCFKPFKGGFIW